MHIKRFADARPYDAPNHFDMRSLRLQGFEPGGPEAFWVGISHLLPGGGAGPDATPLEKVYVVLAGELTVTVAGETHVLRPLDSCRIAPNEERLMRNESNQVVSLLVVLPYPPKKS